MRKLLFIYFVAFVGFGMFISYYLLAAAPAGIPESYLGTPADPATFMSPQELAQSTEYSRLRSVIYFISVPFEWGIYLLLIALGISHGFRNWAERIGSKAPLHAFVCGLIISVFAYAMKLPISIFSYRLAVHYGISNQSWLSWIRDQSISLAMAAFSTGLVTAILFFLLKKSPGRWWLHAWFISLPLSFLLFYAQPLFIDPLYHDFQLLQDEQLEGRIIEMAASEGVPAERVYVVNKSEKTNAINAYVNGIGTSLRIVLYDTAIERLDQDETLYIMAHEIGHYVMNHLSWALIGNMAGTLAGLYVLHLLYHQIVKRWGTSLRARSKHDLALAPLLLLLISILAFVSSPISNGISRQAEHAADVFALEKTLNPEAAIRTLQKLSIAGKSEVNPPAAVKWFRYGHPTLFERIQYMMEWENDPSVPHSEGRSPR